MSDGKLDEAFKANAPDDVRTACDRLTDHILAAPQNLIVTRCDENDAIIVMAKGDAAGFLLKGIGVMMAAVKARRGEGHG